MQMLFFIHSIMSGTSDPKSERVELGVWATYFILPFLLRG